MAKDLCPYCRYPKLYVERRYACNCLAHPFRFLYLPTELYVMVCKAALLFLTTIESWPKFDLPIASLQNSINGRNFQYFKQKLNSQNVNVGLLRTSKLVSQEARRIFHCSND
jgi:hypothetical protein